MLLFRGDFGCLLYTGDFRWEMSSERANKGRIALLNALEDNTVDVLYLDNTYCNPSYAFPSREIAARQVKNSSGLFLYTLWHVISFPCKNADHGLDLGK